MHKIILFLMILRYRMAVASLPAVFWQWPSTGDVCCTVLHRYRDWSKHDDYGAFPDIIVNVSMLACCREGVGFECGHHRVILETLNINCPFCCYVWHVTLIVSMGNAFFSFCLTLRRTQPCRP